MDNKKKFEEWADNVDQNWSWYKAMEMAWLAAISSHIISCEKNPLITRIKELEEAIGEHKQTDVIYCQKNNGIDIYDRDEELYSHLPKEDAGDK